MVYYKKIHKKD